MGEYEINNPHALIEQAGNVYQLGQNTLRVQEELNSFCYQISSAWQSDTVDKETYLKTLQENLVKIETLVHALTALSNNLNAYAERAIANKANSYQGISGTIV